MAYTLILRSGATLRVTPSQAAAIFESLRNWPAGASSDAQEKAYFVDGIDLLIRKDEIVSLSRAVD